MSKLRQLGISSTTATFELVDTSCYYSTKPFNVYINERKCYEDYEQNVISIYDLEPATSYTIKVDIAGEVFTYQFSTLNESLCLDVKQFGAVGDGVTDDTDAIQAAIMACPKDGRIYLTGGCYLCKPLYLKSFITIELGEGATILGVTERSNYPILPAQISENTELPNTYIVTWEGEPAKCFASLITGIAVESVSIVGRGVIDGNAQNGDWWIDAKVMRQAWRPNLVYFSHCKNIYMQGVTLQNSPSWTLHPFFSDNLKFLDLVIINPKDSPNTDGLDPDSCEKVDIIGVDFSVGDDCIAIKSGKYELGSKFKRTSKEIQIRNCRMRYGHGAVVLGSEMSGGIRDINVSQCLFYQTDRGLRIKTRRGRGSSGIIENIHFENITMQGVHTPFVINMFYFCDPDGKTEYVWSKEKLPVNERTPHLTAFSFKHIRCYETKVAACYIYGLPEKPVDEVIFKDVLVTYDKVAKQEYPAMMSYIEAVKKIGFFINNVKVIKFEDIQIIGQEGEAFIIENQDTLHMDNIQIGKIF